MIAGSATSPSSRRAKWFFRFWSSALALGHTVTFASARGALADRTDTIVGQEPHRARDLEFLDDAIVMNVGLPFG